MVQIKDSIVKIKQKIPCIVLGIKIQIKKNRFKQVTRYKSLGLLNNGLELHLKNNKVEKFVVEHTEALFLEINKHIIA